MRNIILRRIPIYVVAFIFCLVISLESAKAINSAYQEFYSNLNSIMQEYGYTDTATTRKYPLNPDSLEFSDGSNVIKYERFTKREDETRMRDFYAYINLYYDENLLATLDFLNEVYDREDIRTYQNEIQNLIEEYQSTNEAATLNEHDGKRQIVIRIRDSEDKDFQLYYHVFAFFP